VNFRREFLAGIAESRLKHFDAAIARFQVAEKFAREKLPDALDFRFYFQVGSVSSAAARCPRPKSTC
jgi:hypothetical protein